MAKMFMSKEEEPIQFDSTQTILGESVKVEGTFTSAGDVTIHGEFTGSLKTTGDLTIKDTAKVKADIETKNLVLGGEVQGNVICHGQLQMQASGKLVGDVTTEALSVETGAVIQGKWSTRSMTSPNSVSSTALPKAN